MKILFFLALLINIIFFLWELKTGAVDNILITKENTPKTKQILLLSEVEESDLYRKKVTETKQKSNIPSSINTVETLVTQKPEISADNTITPDYPPIVSTKKLHEEIPTPAAPELDKAYSSLTIESKQNKADQDLSHREISVTKNKANVFASPKTVETKVIPSPQETIIAVENSSTVILKKENKEKLKSLALETEKTQTSLSDKNKANESDDQKSPKQPSLNPKVGSQPGMPVLPENFKTGAVTTEPQIISKKLTLQKNTQFCYEIGPFINKQRLDNWVETNQIKRENTSIISKTDPEQSKFLVYYPAAINYAQSKENSMMLEKKGIKDLWLFRRGELRGVISLGLFAKHSRAVSLQNKLAKKGIQAEIMKRQNGEPEYFVQIKTEDEKLKKLILPKKVLLFKCPQTNMTTKNSQDKPVSQFETTDQIGTIPSINHIDLRNK